METYNIWMETRHIHLIRICTIIKNIAILFRDFHDNSKNSSMGKRENIFLQSFYVVFVVVLLFSEMSLEKHTWAHHGP